MFHRIHGDFGKPVYNFRYFFLFDKNYTFHPKLNFERFPDARDDCRRFHLVGSDSNTHIVCFKFPKNTLSKTEQSIVNRIKHLLSE